MYWEKDRLGKLKLLIEEDTHVDFLSKIVADLNPLVVALFTKRGP